MLPGWFLMLKTLIKHFYATYCLYSFASSFPGLVNADHSRNALEACVHRGGEKSEDEKPAVVIKVKVSLENSTIAGHTARHRFLSV